MHANNETGQLTDIARTALICKKYAAVFHSDCVQTIGHYPVNLPAWGVHFASASAHKFHGPKGIGLVYVDPDLKIKPLIWGGGQERQLRAGTENVAGIVGMAKALELFYQRFVIDYEHICDLKKSMTALLGNIFPDIIINGGDQSHYSILSVSFPKNKQAESLLMNLNEKGICVAGGSACSGNNDSHVMSELRRTSYYVTIRFSFSRFNTKQDVEQTVGLIKDWLLRGMNMDDNIN
jgi:cysteine desulfurase